MRKLVVVLLLLVIGFGCRRKNKGPSYAHESPTYENNAPPPAGAAQPNTGTCEAACQHYLACKGVNDQATHDGCVTKCAQANYSQQVLANFSKTDCVSAIYIVEGQPKASGGTGGGSTSKECQGCVWDGSSCIWMSSGNWGSGPYSGAYTACNAACCPGH